jgi:restriction system protein
VTTAWMVRASWEGEREHASLTEGRAIAGWEEVGDLSGVSSRAAMREVVDRTYSDASPARAANWTGRLWRFTHDMSIGDYVATPLKRKLQIAIDRVAGEYEYLEDALVGFRHTRKVEWLKTGISRSAVRQDLLDSMGSLLTVCRLERFEAADRIASLALTGVDPGPPNDEGYAQVSSQQELADRAAEAAAASEPFRMSVRELLDLWGAIRRSASTVAQIEQDLADLGSATRPAFTDAGLHDKVAIVIVGGEPSKAHVPADDIAEDIDAADS